MVARLEQNVLLQLLAVADVLVVVFEYRRLAVRADSDNADMRAVGEISEAARPRDRFGHVRGDDEVHRARVRDPLSRNPDLLAVNREDIHRNVGIDHNLTRLQLIDNFRFYFCLGQPANFDLADQGDRHHAIRADYILPDHVRMLVDPNGDHVLGTDLVGAARRAPRPYLALWNPLSRRPCEWDRLVRCRPRQEV